MTKTKFIHREANGEIKGTYTGWKLLMERDHLVGVVSDVSSTIVAVVHLSPGEVIHEQEAS